MKRTSAAVLLIAGTVGMGYACNNKSTRFSDEHIWARQKAHIENAHVSASHTKNLFYVQMRNKGKDAKSTDEPKPVDRDQSYEKLRNGLEGLKDASDEDRCKFETRFSAVIEKGDEKEADELIKKASFVPYQHCSSWEQTKREAGEWYSLAGAASLLIGLIGMAHSLLTKNS